MNGLIQNTQASRKNKKRMHKKNEKKKKRKRSKKRPSIARSLFFLFPPSTLLNTHKTNTHTEIPRRPYFLSAVAKTHHHDSIHLVAKPTREDAFGEVLRAVRGG